MKKLLVLVVIELVLLWLVFACFAPSAHGQAVPAPIAGIDAPLPAGETPGADVTGALTELVKKAPWVFTVLTVVGALRLLVKPLLAAAHYVAERTATPKDDELLARIENSKVLRAFYFALDWIASVKIRK